MGGKSINDQNNKFFKEANLLKEKLDLSFISDFFKLVVGEELFEVIKGKVYLTSKLQFEHGEEYLNVKNTIKKKFDMANSWIRARSQNDMTAI